VEWKNHAVLGKVLLQGGKRPAAARESFGRAAKIIQEIAASIDDPNLRSSFLNIEDVRQVIDQLARPSACLPD